MKRFSINLYAAVILAFLSVSMTCEDDDLPDTCTESVAEKTKSVNGFDFRTNEVVAVFTFNQDYKTYSGNACQGNQPGGEIFLQIKNVTSQTIKFDYSINYQMGANKWNYQNVATIAPNSIIDVGKIAVSPGIIDQNGSALTIQANQIIYE
ncbi:hypothetical protein [Parapedobacter indicus]|uniref:Uncharacterized protein n=1 Tax=Parapedobacter indicus TaxID=1477437 RepID=A0A1I3E2K4_9SPHI|nr:hypothetical protein [Parapedobacter indicus]PPL04942.1 hypothetical protein CLV26_101752 [Parapedobacter indicus]SFH93217.1 hypothetical protein SAMN05444682_101738 [Parapedobacter indicus]